MCLITLSLHLVSRSKLSHNIIYQNLRTLWVPEIRVLNIPPSLLNPETC